MRKCECETSKKLKRRASKKVTKEEEREKKDGEKQSKVEGKERNIQKTGSSPIMDKRRLNPGSSEMEQPLEQLKNWKSNRKRGSKEAKRKETEETT